MIKLTINEGEGIQIPEHLRLEHWLVKTTKTLGTDEKGMIELNFVDSTKIRALNLEFRGKDKETDVLSFSFLGQNAFPGDNILGQVFISPKIAKKQAEKHGATYQDELEFLFVHALLHIFGHDHENATEFKHMFDLQAQIMPAPKWQRFVDQIFCDSFEKH